MEICPSDISNPDKIIIEPPRFIDDEQIIVQRLAELKDSGIKHLMCGNIAYLKSGKELGFILHGDFSLNVSNSYSAFKLAELGLRDITLSPELRLGQILRLLSPVPTGITAYGRLPLMLTKNCPVKNEIGCKSCRRIVTDRTGRSFKIVCHENYYEILNSQLLYLADHINDIRNIEFLNLYFTDETPSQVSDIIEKYRNDGEKKNAEHYKRTLLQRSFITIIMEKIMTLRIKKLNRNAIIPQRATKGSAGLDLSACIDNDIKIEPGEIKMIPTGISAAPDSENTALMIYPRSGLSSKYGIALANCVGVVDSDYRGEIKVPLINNGNERFL